MSSRLSRIASSLGMLLVLGSIVTSTGLAQGTGTTRCVGEPFSFSRVRTTQFDRDGNGARIGWNAIGTTALDCPDGLLAIDVWEHAVVVVRRQAGGVRLSGRVATRVRIPDGGSVLLGGLMQGSGPCAEGICVVEAEVRTRGPGGETLRLQQKVTIDFSTGRVTDIEVVRIVIEFTSAG